MTKHDAFAHEPADTDPAPVAEPLTESGPLQGELIMGWDAAQNIADEWRALHRADDTVGNHLFNTFDLLDVWQDFYARDYKLMILVVRDAVGALVGLAPLQITQRKLGPLSFRRLSLMHNLFISRTGALMRGDLKAISEEMARVIKEKTNLYDDLVFDGMLAECTAQIALRDAISAAGFATSMTLDDRPLRTVAFDGDEAAFIASRPAKKRQGFNRAIRRCSDLPEFEVSAFEDASEARERFRRLFSLDWLSGKRERPGAVYPVDAKLYHLALTERAEQIGAMDFVEARSEGNLLASIFSVICAGSKYLIVTYSDSDYNSQSPGMLVILRSIGLGLSDPRVNVVDLNGDSLLLEKISTGSVPIGVFKANHRGGLSQLIGLARRLKSLSSRKGAAS